MSDEQIPQGPAEPGQLERPAQAEQAVPTPTAPPRVPVQPQGWLPPQDAGMSWPPQQTGMPWPPQAPGWGAPSMPFAPFGPPQRTGTNALAVASFVLGLIALVPVSVVLGIVGLVSGTRKQQRGRGFAVAGLVLSGLWVVGGMAGLIGSAVYASSHGAPGTRYAPGARAFSALSPGTCFNRPAGSTSQYVSVVACDTDHNGQFLAVVKLPDTGLYPGDTALENSADAACMDSETAAFPDQVGLPSTAELRFRYPSEQTWANGSRNADCFYQTSSGTLSQQMVQKRGDFTADQLAFLAMDRVRVVQASRYEFMADKKDWSNSVAYAAATAAAYRSEAAALTGRQWPITAAGPAKALAAVALKRAVLWDALVSADSDAARTAAEDAKVAEASGFNASLGLMRVELGLPK